MIEAKNPRYNSDGSIELEVLHEKHGWIPYTARPATKDAKAHALHEMAVRGEFGEIAPALPPPVIPINKIQSRKLAEINETCSVHITNGFESTALGTLHHYKLDLEDQANLAGSIEAAKETQAPVPFKCTDAQGAKAYRLHTPAQIIQVGLDAYAHKLNTLQTADALQAEIEAATSETELSAITWPNPD